MKETTIELTGQALVALYNIVIYFFLVIGKALAPSPWTTLKWTTPKNNNPNEYYLMFLAASIIKLHITSA